MPFVPGPLLRPNGLVPGANFTAVSCQSDVELTDIAKFAQVTATGVVFCNSDKVPVFESASILSALLQSANFLPEIYAFLESNFMERDHRLKLSTTDFNQSRRVWDDIDLRVVFETFKDAEAFRNRIFQVSAPETREYHLCTKTYVLDGRIAKLLPGSHAISQLVNTTLTSLAFTDTAEILAPVYDWSVPHTSAVLKVAKNAIHGWLQKKRPPLVIIADEGVGALDSFDIRDDLEGSIDPDILPTLPRIPTWPLNQVNQPSDNKPWLVQIISNYGVHGRHRNSDQPPTIILSLELVRWYLAAQKAASAHGSGRGATMSLHAAAGSLKMTLVHELSHLYVTDNNAPHDSPPRDEVAGANTPKFDAAEDEERKGMIEAGYLVETAWLGGPHKLVLNNDGWLAFVIGKHTPAYPLAAVDVLDSSSDEDSDEVGVSLFQNLARRSSTSDDGSTSSSASSGRGSSAPISGHLPAPHRLNEESEVSSDSASSSTSSRCSSSPPNSGHLGSPIQLTQGQRRTASAPIFRDEALAAVEEQDRIQDVIVCTEETLKSLWAPGLPRLHDGITGDSSPLVRNKRHVFTRPSPSPSLGPPTPRASTPSGWRALHNNLSSTDTVPLVKAEGLPRKWPSVVGRRDEARPSKVEQG
ncbi:hypothetical protein B0H19DRAFT_1261859 [Mycena capillaripes]|nr:hypothetical protein B0H19DRAFT_1261859 [Mycena capillaripes]